MAKVSLDVTLSEEEARRLNETFGQEPAKGQAQVDAAAGLVGALAKAGLREYVLYVTGERVPAGVRDLRELRLWLLSKYLPGGLPNDPEVASLFHLTSAQARNLVAGTRARYPNEFVALFAEAARTALREAEKIDPKTFRITANASLAAFLLDLLAESTVPEPAKRPDASRRYDLAQPTVNELCKRLGMQASEVGTEP